MVVEERFIHIISTHITISQLVVQMTKARKKILSSIFMFSYFGIGRQQHLYGSYSVSKKLKSCVHKRIACESFRQNSQSVEFLRVYMPFIIPKNKTKMHGVSLSRYTARAYYFFFLHNLFLLILCNTVCVFVSSPI